MDFSFITLILWFFVMWMLFRYVGSKGRVESSATAASTETTRLEKLGMRFIMLTEVNPLALFKLASKDRGFGWSDDEVEQHYSIYIQTHEFPNYVAMFLIHEEESINSQYENLKLKH